jgi:hypothetical protein
MWIAGDHCKYTRPAGDEDRRGKRRQGLFASTLQLGAAAAFVDEATMSSTAVTAKESLALMTVSPA